MSFRDLTLFSVAKIEPERSRLYVKMFLSFRSVKQSYCRTILPINSQLTQKLGNKGWRILEDFGLHIKCSGSKAVTTERTDKVLTT